jgi:hypothetical protein
MVHALAPGILDLDRGVELLRFRADVIFPNHLACARLQRRDEATASAARFGPIHRHPVFIASAGDHYLAVS